MRKTPILLALGAALAAGALLLIDSGNDAPEAALEPGGLVPGATDTTAPRSTLLEEAAAPPRSENREAVARVRTEEEKAEERAATRQAEAEAGPFLQGTVFGSDGHPLRGAEVQIEGQLLEGFMGLGKIALNQKGETDRNGDFALSRGRWPAHDVSVSIKARGHLPSKENRMPDANTGDSHLGTFVLQRGVVLGGHVYDAKGKPVEGAEVRRTSIEDTGAMDGMIRLAATFGQWSESKSTTDADGAFELPFEALGPYALIVEHEDFPKARYESETPPEGGEDLAIVIRMAPTALIAGRILDYPGDDRNATVSAVPVRTGGSEPAPMEQMFGGALSGDDKAQVAEDGSFEIRGLEVGRSYEVQAFVKDGFFGRSPASQKLEVASGDETVELAWESGARIVFDVEDAGTGRPLRGGTVRYRWQGGGGGFSAMARKALDYEGTRVEIGELRPNPSPAKLELAVFADGYLEHRVQDIEVHDLKTVDLGVIRLNQAPKFRVRVIDERSGKPVKKARVVLQPRYGSTDDLGDSNIFSLGGKVQTGRTDSEGVCVLEACATDTADLTVNKGGYAATVLEELAMPSGGDAVEVVQLAKGGEVRVQVFDAEGEPAANARVIHRGPDDDTQTLSTNARGEARIRDLPTGPHAFAAERGEGGRRGRRGRRGGARVRVNEDGQDDRAWQEAVVTSGGRVELKFELPPTARIEGQVLLRGQPVAQAAISLFEGEEGSDQDEYRAQLNEQMSNFMPNRPASTRTDSDGRFVLDEVETGKYRIRVGRPGGMPSHYEPIDVRLGTNRAEISLPGSAVEGRVVDAEGGGVAGASVQIHRYDPEDPESGRDARMDLALSFFGARSNDGVRTDADGNFVIEGVPTDTPLVVEARAPGYVPNRSKDFKVAEESLERGVKVEVSQAGSIRVQVEGTTAMFQSVTATRQVGEGEHATTKMGMIRDGTALLTELEPGTWRVSQRESDVFDEVEVVAGQESFVTLTD